MKKKNQTKIKQKIGSIKTEIQKKIKNIIIEKKLKKKR